MKKPIRCAEGCEGGWTGGWVGGREGGGRLAGATTCWEGSGGTRQVDFKKRRSQKPNQDPLSKPSEGKIFRSAPNMFLYVWPECCSQTQIINKLDFRNIKSSSLGNLGGRRTPQPNQSAS